MIAALLKTSNDEILHYILTSKYIKPETERYSSEKFVGFDSFQGHSDVLQLALATEKQKFLSPAAELIKRQADRSDVTFGKLMEAELLICLMALISEEGRWLPLTLVYSSHSDFSFFVRATQHLHFNRLLTITGLSSAEAVRTAAQAGMERLESVRWSPLHSLLYTLQESLNLAKLDTIA